MPARSPRHVGVEPVADHQVAAPPEQALASWNMPVSGLPRTARGPVAYSTAAISAPAPGDGPSAWGRCRRGSNET